MVIRKAIVISILVLLGISCAGAVMVLYNSVRASVQSFPEALNSIPSDYQFVFGINVQKLTGSSAFAKLQQNRQVGKELQSFVEKTGLDPQRDISYLVGAGRANGSVRNEGIVIAVGQFNKDRIVSFIRSKSAPTELQYGSASLLMIPDTKTNAAPDKGIAFLSEREIALGDLNSLKAALDIRGKENESILSNETMAPLIRSISPDDMLWFAGDAASVLAKAPATVPLGQSASSIKSFVGTLNIGDAVTGKITAIAVNADSATKLADAIRGLIALGQLTGNQHPELKTLLGGLAVSQNATEVTLGLNFPPELLDRIGQSGKIPSQPAFR
jgi:hypothetical protein